jgi:hypothetical protein
MATTQMLQFDVVTKFDHASEETRRSTRAESKYNPGSPFRPFVTMRGRFPDVAWSTSWPSPLWSAQREQRPDPSFVTPASALSQSFRFERDVIAHGATVMICAFETYPEGTSRAATVRLPEVR